MQFVVADEFYIKLDFTFMTPWAEAAVIENDDDKTHFILC